MSKLINNLPIQIEDIEDGLDRKQLNFLRQRFLQINQSRLERSAQALTERQQQFLTLIPLLLHVNHPLLPGYVSNQTPCGISHYTPQKSEIQLTKVFARSFHLPKEFSIKEPAIDALFIMGSPGSIAQNDISDLDLWVCHSKNLTDKQQELLQRKIDTLSNWAHDNIHLTLHCFLMQSGAFKDEKHLAFNNEASGSAQYFLLLDEFYRTALWLAGKIPLWWFIPAEREKDYDNFSEILLQKRFIKAIDIIDFGGIAKIPAEEYLGAGIWQLYKAIESPYKSVLKLLLLEIYATQEDSLLNQPLALGFKQAVYSGITDPDQLDPYVFIYKRIETYLSSTQNFERLDLIRRCFYFKINRHLSNDKRQIWQLQLLRLLVTQWNWSNAKLKELDNRSQWKVEQVIEEHRLLVNELNHSYQLLHSIHKRLGLQAAINREQLMILGRKLSAIFERRAGKINFVNPGISSDLTEPELQFFHNALGTSAWSLHTSHEHDVPHLASNAIKHSPQLIELIIWSFANGLITPNTKLTIKSEYFDTNFSQVQLMSCIKNWLPSQNINFETQSFHSHARVKKFLVIANLGIDPQKAFSKRGLHLISSQNDALGYSGFKENLIQTLDCIYVNSWGEIFCRHFEQDAVICLMQYCLQYLDKQTLNFPMLEFHCFHPGKGGLIAQRLRELWSQFHSCFFSSTQKNQRFLFEISNEYWIIQSPLDSDQSVFHTHNYAHLLKQLALPRTLESKLTIDKFAMRNTPLPIIFHQFLSSFIQLFYSINQQVIDLYFLDNKGALIFHQSYFYNLNHYLKSVLHFLQSFVHKLEFSNDGAINILCHELIPGKTIVNSLPADWQLVAKRTENDFNLQPLFRIKAIVEEDVQGRLNYLIFCNEQEFSSLVDRDAVFVKTATYIKQHRKTNLNYPCYITDLEICRYHQMDFNLQLMEFWQMKIFLEDKINLAYRSL